MVKLSNAFTWDTDQTSDLDPGDTSTHTDENGQRHQTDTVYTDERRLLSFYFPLKSLFTVTYLSNIQKKIKLSHNSSIFV